MPKLIDHEQRKREILNKAISLFAKNGYKETSLSNLAESCKISRPTLYQYFNDKEEIFEYALKNFTDSMYRRYKMISKRGMTNLEILKTIYADIVIRCFRNTDFLLSLSDYVLQESKNGVGFSDRVRRRTIRFEYLISGLLGRAERDGEVKGLNRALTVEHIMRMVQALFFQIVYNGGTGKRDREIAIFNSWIDSISII